MSDVSAVAYRLAALDLADNGSKARSPTKFISNGRHLSAFKVQILLYPEAHKEKFKDELSKIYYICSCLTGPPSSGSRNLLRRT